MTRTLRLTTPHTSGKDVKEAQRLLSKPGYYTGAIDGQYGPITASATHKAKWALGYGGKDVNNVYGADLAALLNGSKKPSILMRQRAKARAEAAQKQGDLGNRIADRMTKWAVTGWKEQPSGSNVVPQLQALARSLKLAAYYVNMGFPWCAFAVMTAALCEGSAAAKAGLVDGKYNALYTPELRQVSARGAFGLHAIPVRQISRGVAVEFDFGGSNGSEVDHIGLALGAPGEKVTVNGQTYKPKKSQVVTVEGNTSSDDAGSQSNGGCMAIKVRDLSLIACAFTIS